MPMDDYKIIVEQDHSTVMAHYDVQPSILNLEAQISQREKQYKYYQNKLLKFE